MAMLNNQMVLNMFILFGQYVNIWKEVHITFIYICHHVLYVTIKQSEPWPRHASSGYPAAIREATAGVLVSVRLSGNCSDG